MPTTIFASTTRRSTAFVLIFALANVGAVLSYLPLLTLLLPLKIEGMAGGAHIGLFTTAIVTGGIAASISNIAFGWASDWTRRRGIGRRIWVAGGLIATALAYVGIALADGPTTVVVAVVLFQIAINIWFAPMFAIMAEEIADRQKGIASGWLAIGSPLASAFSALVVLNVAFGEAARLSIIVAAVVACTVPLLLTRVRQMVPDAAPTPVAIASRRDLAIAWAARMAVQVAGVVLSLYLLYYFESLAPAGRRADIASDVGRLLTIAYAIPVPIALLVGRMSDRIGRRKPFLLGAAAVAAAGLGAMALAQHWSVSAIGYGLYAAGSAVFLALHSGFSMQLLPDPDHRGRDLGILNLTNTLPNIVGPMLAWMLATPRDFAGLMLVLAVLTLAGGVAILAIEGRR